MMHPALSAMLLVALLQATFSSAVPNPLGTVDEARSKGAVNELIGDSTAGEGDVAQVGGDKSGVENEVEHGPDELGQDEEYVNSLLPKETVESLGLYGGDIRLTPKQRKEIIAMEKENEAENNVEKRAVTTQTQDLWPNGRVPYTISSRLGSSARSAITSAIAQYSRDTCIRFVPRTTERNYVLFISDYGCYSYVGRTGGRQVVSIGRGCERKGIVMHEMFHALGRWHEQSRPDRDSYIRVNFQNIERGAESNFEKLRSYEAKTQNIGYDFRSLMHYSAYSFSKNNLPTITPRVNGVSTRDLGQRSGFTAKDLDHVNTLYCGNRPGTPAPAGTWSSWSSWSSCSVTCEQGIQRRVRTCQGTGCVGTGNQIRACNTNTRCFQWGSWSAWRACSTTCNNGVQTRSRTCARGRCIGSSTDSRSCKNADCPGVWSPWSSWEACSQQCGIGEQVRTRGCSGGQCSGSGREKRDCIQAPFCLIGANWGPWGQWSPCSATCGYNGRQSRTRTCSGDTCTGSDTETIKCNIGSCPHHLTGEPGLGPWGPWRVCSRSCGGGFQTGVRKCLTLSRGCRGRTFRLQGCNYHSCVTPVPPVVITTREPLTVDGYANVSCHVINLAEGNSDLYTLNKAKPFTSDIVKNCVDLAASKGFHYVGITGGYCNSGSDDKDSYTGTPESDQCENGIGSLSSTSPTAYMDVYRIESSTQ